MVNKFPDNTVRFGIPKMLTNLAESIRYAYFRPECALRVCHRERPRIVHVADTEGRLGWRPVWNTERSLHNIDDEIDAILEEGKAKSSLVGSLFASARG
ncbi:hypothetical protein BU26DRAFT_296445 [Trematosphaeria pertusa]|uniref:Uncharacterized protein n=1 Tax=Trematosphaeria pertusa TaxID=390896 RepID=A0A6A6IIZ0_9PLEO|nr:uncharacterized protein BU26DRAFT_296445 [Trematosphaeria pertusa]KAF2250147.1 hypothetical protein BU26DRAFT_296445 [Trematosphaeria pertusa]